ncbi:hypothetical protein Tco_0523097 [Tanacetum coccineum]
MKPALVLDDSCYQDRDFSLSLLGKVNEFSSLSNLKIVLDMEGFTDITIKCMGGLWVLISFQSIKAKENFLSHVGAGSWFSSLQQPSDSKRVCIKTKMVENIFESFKIIVKGKVYWTRVKEVTGWNPDFMEEEDTQTESDNATIQSESDEERIPETVFENEKDSFNEAQSQNKESVKAQSEDPFNINDILNKKHENVIVGDRSQTADTLKYPPGENTMSQEDVVSNKPNHKPKEDGEVSACSGHFQKATTPQSQGSFLQFMEELVKVGHTMGYKMDGCNQKIEESIEFQRVKAGESCYNGGASMKDSHLKMELVCGLVDVPMGGCSFTWVYKSAAKMSKLDRFLISEGYANSDLLNNCKNVMTSLLDMEKIKSLEVAQKAKIKWSIEGNENSKFLHDEFLSHFKNRFDCLSSTRLFLDMNFPNQISSDVQVDLEKDVSLKNSKDILGTVNVVNAEQTVNGITVDDDIVNQAAHSIGCLQLKSPFSYLGSRIGGSMSCINSWDDIVNKLLARLSKWKMKTLSIGGRPTLLKSVLGSTPIYYMSVLKRMESIRSPHLTTGSKFWKRSYLSSVGIKF